MARGNSMRTMSKLAGIAVAAVTAGVFLAPAAGAAVVPAPVRTIGVGSCWTNTGTGGLTHCPPGTSPSTPGCHLWGPVGGPYTVTCIVGRR